MKVRFRKSRCDFLDNFVHYLYSTYCYNLEATGVGGLNLGPGDPSLDYTNSVGTARRS